MLLDENITLKEHTKFIENKCAKSIGLLYKAKHHLNKKCLLALYYSYVHTIVIRIYSHLYQLGKYNTIHKREKTSYTKETNHEIKTK